MSTKNDSEKEAENPFAGIVESVEIAGVESVKAEVVEPPAKRKVTASQSPEYRQKMEQARILISSGACSVRAAAEKLGLSRPTVEARASREGWRVDKRILSSAAIPKEKLMQIGMDAMEIARKEHVQMALSRGRALQVGIDNVLAGGVETAREIADLCGAEDRVDVMLRRNLGLDQPAQGNSRIGTVNVLSLGSMSLTGG